MISQITTLSRLFKYDMYVVTTEIEPAAITCGSDQARRDYIRQYMGEAIDIYVIGDMQHAPECTHRSEDVVLCTQRSERLDFDCIEMKNGIQY